VFFLLFSEVLSLLKRKKSEEKRRKEEGTFLGKREKDGDSRF